MIKACWQSFPLYNFGRDIHRYTASRWFS